MNICVIGTGYVGLVTGVVFADLGNDVICVDRLEEKVASLQKGVMPIYEPGLEELAERNVAEGRLLFTTDLADAVRKSEVVFICVGTPPQEDGSTDLSQVEGAARGIAAALDRYKVIVNKSTVPVGTGEFVRSVIEINRRRNVDFDVVSNPEFLREGSAIQDALNPDRIVVGAPNKVVAMKILELYAPLERPMFITDVASAEMIKYASNAFLATKISFINSIANLCDAYGADVVQVAKGMGADNRIGSAFLHAGIGYGGSCFLGEETLTAIQGNVSRTITFEEFFRKTRARWIDKDLTVAHPFGWSALAFDMERQTPVVSPIEVLTQRNYSGILVTLKSSMGRVLRVTADHPVILSDANGNLSVKRADRVEKGETLLTLLRLPSALEESETASLNLIELLKDTELEKDVHVEPRDDVFSRLYGSFSTHIPKEMMRYPHEIKRYNRMPLRLFRFLSEGGHLSVPAENLRLYTAKGNGCRINASIPLDERFLRMLGYYLAEGCIAKDTGRAGAVRERVLFSFHEDESEYIREVRETLEGLGMHWIERRAHACSTTIVSSRIFGFLLRDALGCGTRSEDKALPTVALSVAAPLRRALLEGVYRGDGAVEWHHGGRNLNFTCATVSKRLADGLVVLLQSLGIVPSVKKQWMNKSTRPAYHLDISGIEQVKAVADLFGEKHRERIGATMAGYRRSIRQRGFDRRGAVATLVIREVVHDWVSLPVYSLETEAATVVVGAGVVAHNCFPKDSLSLLHTAKMAEIDFPILAAAVDTNAHQPVRFLDRMEKALGGFAGKKVGVWGLAFKANTDDMRDAKSLEVIAALLAGGAEVSAYDPISMENTRKIFPQITYAKNAFEAARDVDAVIVVTEWNEFKQVNLEKLAQTMSGKWLFDGRNIYDPEKVRRVGLQYLGVGRGGK